MTGSKLAGKVAFVTGGSAGIGLGIAPRFAQAGARMFVIDRRQPELDKAITAIGGNAAAIQGDTSNLADLDRIYAPVSAQAGRIDVLAANAGVYEFGTAKAAVFLPSDDSAYITGIELFVDGGAVQI